MSFDGLEAQFQDAVADLLRMSGWKVNHQRPGRTADGWNTATSYDGVGFPDLLCLHPNLGWVWAIECKAEGGRLSEAQEQWADWFEDAERNSGETIRYFVLKPSSWDRFVAFLENHMRRPFAHAPET